jgi:hypothetical protein
MERGSERTGFIGKALLVFSILGMLIGVVAITGVVLASHTEVQVFEGPWITVTARFVSLQVAGDDVARLTIEACATNNAPSESTLSARITAYSDADLTTATRYAFTSFHNKKIAAGSTLCEQKGVIVLQWSKLTADEDGLLVGTGFVKRDGVAYQIFETKSVNFAQLTSDL